MLNQKDCSNNISHLDIKDLTVKEMQRLLAELEELIGEFREESDYETAIKYFKKKSANDEEKAAAERLVLAYSRNRLRREEGQRLQVDCLLGTSV